MLKIFDAFATPTKGTLPVQIVYVTHSPFLIDKNHGERIRVVEKGARDEGTRVVGDASRNHYEPLRSAFGSFVAETAFIGNCNLFVEGQADQILLAGATTYLRSIEASELETLDLNRITIVPAGGAAHIPYLVYLARGRDVDKPAVIVMVDSDAAGNEAKSSLSRGGPRRKQLLNASYILSIGELAATGTVDTALGGALIETEDLIPLPICVDAAQRYLRDVCAEDGETVAAVTSGAISACSSPESGVFKAIQECFRRINGNLHIEKIGFARAVIETLADRTERATTPDGSEAAQAVARFSANMKVLFRRLRSMQRQAERELTAERISARIDRAKLAFLDDHPAAAKREDVFILFESMLTALDDSDEADEIKRQIQSIRRDFSIDEDVSKEITNFALLRDRLETMRYAARLAHQRPTLQEALRKDAASIIAISDMPRESRALTDADAARVSPIPVVSPVESQDVPAVNVT